MQSDNMANGVLKQIFQELHYNIIVMNPDPVMDLLFSENLIGVDDCCRLRQSFPVSRDRCRELLYLMQHSEHPQVFIRLRLALLELPEYSWIVEEIDLKLPSLISQLQQLHLGDCTDGMSVITFGLCKGKFIIC